MCTAIHLQTPDKKHFFGRNLDSSISFSQAVHLIPKHYEWQNIVTQKQEKAKYACVGMGIIVDRHPLLFDGLNEKGLAGAGLYFFKFANFSSHPEVDKTNVSGSDFIYWVLSNFATLQELKTNIQNLIITHTPLKESLPVVPLHWMFTDLTGNSLVIEYTKTGLHVYDNYVGVLTNSPPFPWHITNLSQYITLSPQTPHDTKMGQLLIPPLSQGLGTTGLPGDGSSAARFVRATFFKTNIVLESGESNGISSIFEVLSNVRVTKGSEVKNDEMNYTLYQSAMCQESGTYYYSTYENRQINAVSLAHQTANIKEITSFSYPKSQVIHFQN